jgi:hypothetical protein
MRIVLLASVASLLASAAQAQNQTSFNGLNSADLARFCIYNNTIFSLGSVICTGKTRGLKCIMGPQPTIFDRSALSAAALSTKPNNIPSSFSGIWSTLIEANDPLNDGCAESAFQNKGLLLLPALQPPLTRAEGRHHARPALSSETRKAQRQPLWTSAGTIGVHNRHRLGDCFGRVTIRRTDAQAPHLAGRKDRDPHPVSERLQFQRVAMMVNEVHWIAPWALFPLPLPKREQPEGCSKLGGNCTIRGYGALYPLQSSDSQSVSYFTTMRIK